VEPDATTRGETAPASAAPRLAQAVAGEALGTAFLLAAVVGSGIMAQRLTDDVGIQLLASSLATAGVLGAVILAFGPVSGAHLNPCVTLLARVQGHIDGRAAVAYIGAQLVGAVTGVIVANLMFELPAVTLSTTERSGAGLLVGEVVATVGLLLVIGLLVRAGREERVAIAVAGYIAGAYWFTSSTSFANPAVTAARTLTDTFAGIQVSAAPAFIAAQLLAVPIAWLALVVTSAPED
jgi:arsenate reductase